MNFASVKTTLTAEARFADVLFIFDGSKATYQAAKPAQACVLIVDDESLITELYKTKFTHEGYRVYTAHDGCEALELARRIRPDIVLTDIAMPRCNGWYLLKEMRRDVHLRNVPTIVLSNTDDEVQRREAQIYGACNFIVKSACLPRELVALTAAALQKQRR
jgi:OmpR family response regulator RpaB